MRIQLKNEIDKNDKNSNNLTNKINISKNEKNNLSKEKMNINKKNEKLKKDKKQNNNQGEQNFINQNEIIELHKKIDNLNEKLKRYPKILEQNEKLISIIFSSSDQTMHYSMICKNTDTISYLEKQLYKEFPSFSKSKNFFLCKGTVIDKHKTLDSYKIKNGDILILNKID